MHPKVDPFHAPVYLNYEDKLDSIDENGNVSVSDGPGLGVELDWDYIEKHRTGRVEFE